MLRFHDRLESRDDYLVNRSNQKKKKKKKKMTMMMTMMMATTNETKRRRWMNGGIKREGDIVPFASAERP